MTFPDRFSTRAYDAHGEASGGPTSYVAAITESTQVGEARRQAMALGERAGLDESECGALAIVVTEAATNLAKHATGGILVMRGLGSAPGGVEVLSLDRGPGIRDLGRAMTDGFSTGGTAGHGLGAIKRLAAEFDLFSSTGTGTALVARLWSAAATEAQSTEHVDGVVCVPVALESACGDGWTIIRSPRRTLAVLIDGLGHGIEAARAADAAIRVAREHSGAPPGRIIEIAHEALRPTRGAAMAIAEVLSGEQLVRFAGVGNISSMIATPQETRSMASHNGTVGHAMRTVQEFTYPWSSGATLIMHTDGITTRWRPEAYPGLVLRHPALVAGVLHRDFCRGRDDATVLALRARQP